MTDPAVLRNEQQRKEVRRKEQHMLSKRNRTEHDQDKPRRKRAAIYLCRFVGGEADPVNGPSINVQRRFCHREAKELDADVVDEFVDVVGAPLPPRGMKRLLDRLDKEPRFDYLIMYSLDRLVPERQGAFMIGWLLGHNHTILVTWVHAYESELKQNIAN